jgi:glutamate racemase
VPLAEEGWVEKKVAFDIAKIYLDPLKSKKIDTLILGCTHYPLLKKVINKIMGPGVVLIDSARESAKEARELLDASGSLGRPKTGGQHKFFVSDEPARFIKMGEHFLKRRITCAKVEE